MQITKDKDSYTNLTICLFGIKLVIMTLTQNYNVTPDAAIDGLCIGDPLYGPAYPTTNEPLATEVKLLPARGKHVLTVAASGDQPMFYAAAGATHIDTFDLTYFARVLMDFKATALRFLNYPDYMQTLYNIRYEMGTMARDRKFSRIIKAMPAETANILWTFETESLINPFFRGGIETEFCPTQYEYEQMQAKIKQPFNFIWGNVTDLPKLTHHQYDIVNLSNISHHLMAHYGPDDVYGNYCKIVKSLLKHNVRIGGHVVTIINEPTRTQVKMIDAMKQTLGTHIDTIRAYPLNGYYGAVIVRKSTSRQK